MLGRGVAGREPLARASPARTDARALPTRPDAYWYTAKLKALADAQQWSRATELLKTMHRQRVREPDAAYRVVIEGCGRAGAVQSAVSTLALMKRHGVPLNARSYTCALRAFARNARRSDAFERAWALYEEMHTRGVPLSTFTVNALLFAVADLARGDLAAAIVERANDERVRLDSTSYDLLIRTSLRAADAGGALIYLHDALKTRQARWCPQRGRAANSQG